MPRTSMLGACFAGMVAVHALGCHAGDAASDHQRDVFDAIDVDEDDVITGDEFSGAFFTASFTRLDVDESGHGDRDGDAGLAESEIIDD